MSTFAVLLVPLLPLLAALVVTVGPEVTRTFRTKIAAYPIGAAFCGAIATLYFVAHRDRLPFDFTILSRWDRSRFRSVSMSIG